MRGAIGRRPPCPPGVSCPASALLLGPLRQPGPLGVPGPWGAGSLFPAGPRGGPGGPALQGWTLVEPHCRFPGPLQVPPLRRLRGRPPGDGGPGGTGRATGPPCPPLKDVGGRLLVVHRGCSVHCVPRQVFQHRPACVVLVCTKGAFRWFCGPSRRGERHRLSDAGLPRLFEGQVGHWNRLLRQRTARGCRIKGSCCGRGPETPDSIALRVCLQPRLPVRGADLAVRLAPPSQVVKPRVLIWIRYFTQWFYPV